VDRVRRNRFGLTGVDISALFVRLHETAFATAIRQNGFLFPWIESVHVLAFSLVVGSILIVDLRLLGVASVNRSVSSLSGEVLPFTWTAFVFAALTGSALFASHAVGYAHNFQFLMKMLLLALAGANMLVFHFVAGPSTEHWNEAGMAPWQGKIAGLISLMLWIGIVAFGRWIGFAAVP
jgi:hypothetical protein